LKGDGWFGWFEKGEQEVIMCAVTVVEFVCSVHGTTSRRGHRHRSPPWRAWSHRIYEGLPRVEAQLAGDCHLGVAQGENSAFRSFGGTSCVFRMRSQDTFQGPWFTSGEGAFQFLGLSAKLFQIGTIRQ
jgi:hypothetical protein